MTGLSIRVFGPPAVAGSKTVVPTKAGPRVVDGGSKAARAHRATWRSDVVDATRRHLPDDWTPIDGPVTLTITFHLPRPKSVPTRRRDGSIPMPTTRPDATKLLRATEDALTVAGVWRDDSQVVNLHVAKAYADDHQLPGASIYIEAVG